MLGQPPSQSVRIDKQELVAKIGLKPADERPILESIRRANETWRRARRERIAAHARRVEQELTRLGQTPGAALLASRQTMGKRRAVLCVELKLVFPTLSAAARFVGRHPSNICQSLKRGVRCGPFHWKRWEE